MTAIASPGPGAPGRLPRFPDPLESAMRPVALLSAALAAAVLLTPAPAAAQDASDDALARYNAQKKDEFTAAGLEMTVPVLGHAYAGDASAGLSPLVVRGGDLILLIVGSQVGCRDEFGGTCIREGNEALMWLGIGGYVAGRIWGVVSALELAREHNDRLRERLDLALVPTPEGAELVVSIPVSF